MTEPTPPESLGDNVRSLDRLMFPKRIAIAGLSARPRAWGQMAYRYLMAGGFAGEVVAYRPRHEETGVAVIRDFSEAGDIDLVVVAVPARGAVEVIREASNAGVGAAVVFSSGFAEEGGDGIALQASLVEAAGAMPMLGPNCLGLVSDPANVVVSVSAFLGRPRRSGPVGLVSQSGAMGFILAEHLRRRGVGFSFYASTGNEAALGASDLLGYVSARPEVKVVGCYLEGVRDVAAWRKATREAREAGCEVVVLKVGRSEAAERAALSHTASAAGDAEMFDAASRDDGVTLVGDEESFAEAVTALTRPVRLPARPGLAVVTMSGGGGAMIADQLGPQARVPALAERTRTSLRSLGIALAGDGNPVDLTGMFFAHVDRLDEVISTVSGDDSIDGTVLYFTFGDQLVEHYRSLAATLGDRPIPTWLVWAGAPDGEVEAQVGSARVVGSIPALVRALAAQPRECRLELGTVQSRRQTHGGGGLPDGSVLTEAVLSPWLSAHGLPYVEMAVGDGPDEVVDAVERLGIAPPWIVKVDHPGAPHRGRLGLVSAGLRDAGVLRGELERLYGTSEKLGLRGARLVVEPMVSHVGMFSLGALRHSQYGPMLLVGPGGDQVEARDARRAAACLPLTDRSLAALCDHASAVAGREVTPEALVGPLLALESLLHNDASVLEVDVNPVLVTVSGGLIAVDALAGRGGAGSEQPPRNPEGSSR